MLNWLKEILGDTYSEEIDKKISEKIGEGFVARSDFNTLNEAKKKLDEDVKLKDELISERDSQIEELKKVDPQTFKEEIARLQEENKEKDDEVKKKDEEYAAALAKIEEDKAIEQYLEAYEFTSKAAKKAITEEFREAGLTFKDGKHLGADDFMKQKREDDPDSFVDENGKRKPRFGGEADKGGKPPTEKMTIDEAMKYVNDHPETDINDLNIG